MSPPLFLIDALPSGEQLQLRGDEGRHAARVQRLRAGERLLVSDGAGNVLGCTVTAELPDGLALQVNSRHRKPSPDPRIVIVQALPKGERAELAVELLTELGADEIVPWAASRSIVQWHGPRGAKALEKWRRTAREATKQSRRPWLPVVTELAATEDVVQRLAGATALVLHEEAAEPLAAVPLPTRGELVVIVGPEGGIAPEEVVACTAAGARAVRLGAPVLRTSTAGAAALAALSVRLGRWV